MQKNRLPHGAFSFWREDAVGHEPWTVDREPQSVTEKTERYPLTRLINVQNEKTGHQNLRVCQEL
jgi:hypothetical protein